MRVYYVYSLKLMNLPNDLLASLQTIKGYLILIKTFKIGH